MDEHLALQKLVEVECSITLAEALTQEQLEQALAEHINALINYRFSDLVRLLYRVDVDEERLRMLLANQTTQDAAVIMARLIVERQRQKIETRKQFNPGRNSSEEERW
jgi:hypothetical protein